MKKLIHCLWYDLREGTLRMWPLYLLEFIFVSFFAVNEINGMKMQGFLPNVSEVSVKVFEGFQEYQYIKGGPMFEIPMKYLLFTLLAGIFVIYYPRREWKLRGNMYLSRYRSKHLWWISKCIWCLLQSFLIYFTAYLSIVITTCCMGTYGYGIREEAQYFFEGPLLIKEDDVIACYIWLLGFVTLLAMNQFLVLFQMLASPVAGYVIFIAVITGSAFYFKNFMIGNYFMLLRTAVFQENGVRLWQGLILAGTLWFLEVLAGYLIIRKKDVLG